MNACGTRSRTALQTMRSGNGCEQVLSHLSSRSLARNALIRIDRENSRGAVLRTSVWPGSWHQCDLVSEITGNADLQQRRRFHWHPFLSDSRLCLSGDTSGNKRDTVDTIAPDTRWSEVVRVLEGTCGRARKPPVTFLTLACAPTLLQLLHHSQAHMAVRRELPVAMQILSSTYSHSNTFGRFPPPSFSLSMVLSICACHY